MGHRPEVFASMVPATKASDGLDASNWTGTRGQTARVFIVLATGVSVGVQVNTTSEAKLDMTCRKS